MWSAVVSCAGGYLASSLDSQSSPSYRPVPWVAQVAWTCHWRERTGSHTRTHTTPPAPTPPAPSSYGPAPQAVQAQLVGQLAHSHGVWKILFVSKHQDDGVFQLVLLDLRTTKTPGVM